LFEIVFAVGILIPLILEELLPGGRETAKRRHSTFPDHQFDEEKQDGKQCQKAQRGQDRARPRDPSIGGSTPERLDRFTRHGKTPNF
jgi:hypothetical protein